MERTAGDDRPPSDRDLMVRLAAGDREALPPLMERHYRRLYRIALAYLRNPDDALDAVQETFVKAFQNAVRWDGASEVGPWLSRIAVNHAIDRYRREKRRRRTLAPFDDGARELPATDQPSPERTALGREVGVKIAAALRALPEKQRAVFVLRHYEEHTLEEIAGVLGLSLGTVKSSLHRAIRGLRERLAGLSA
jgi:RNA polymerase sigma factor (sigma-70 family)